jgi:hypothetical protein
MVFFCDTTIVLVRCGFVFRLVSLSCVPSSISCLDCNNTTIELIPSILLLSVVLLDVLYSTVFVS